MMEQQQQVEEGAKCGSDNDGQRPKTKKIHKKKAAKLLLLQSLLQTFVFETNIYGVPKRLLIFDLNKVLIYRKNKFSDFFELRPYAVQFIKEMSLR